MGEFNLINLGSIGEPAAGIINHYKRCIKEYANQTDVVEIALEHLNREARPEEVTDDWITFFFDKVRNINESYMKIIWGIILRLRNGEQKGFSF